MNTNNDNWRDWLVLLHAPGVGPVTWFKLMQHFGSPQAVLAAGRKAQLSAGLRETACDWLDHPDPKVVETGLSWLALPGNHLISIDNPNYPPLLTTISNPPPILFVSGNPALLCQPQIAIVGTRNPTSGGSSTAREFARTLAAAGFVITSGLAIGIDAAAHEGALSTGTSIAVSATGPDRVYPSANLELAHRIVNTGAMVTELFPGTQVRKENFPQRNRIISGLCLGVLVVEAAAKSGSLITAKIASEQGREVFAIPGSIHNPLSKGCHALIREGAKLVETAEDIVEELQALTGYLLVPGTKPQPTPSIALNLATNSKPATKALDPEQQNLIAHLGHDPVAQEVLIQRCGLSAQTVSQMLFNLELDGHITSVPGGRWIVVR